MKSTKPKIMIMVLVGLELKFLDAHCLITIL
jgi:hypothetical protein